MISKLENEETDQNYCFHRYFVLSLSIKQIKLSSNKHSSQSSHTVVHIYVRYNSLARKVSVFILSLQASSLIEESVLVSSTRFVKLKPTAFYGAAKPGHWSLSAWVTAVV